MKKKLALLGAVVMVGTSLVPTIASADDPAFACTDAGGVYVIVVNQGSGCAYGPSTGVAALNQAGFTLGYAPSGLINQINGNPNPAPDVPPFEAHWSYWYADPNGSLGSHTGFNGWTYSQQGAGTRRPTTGGIEVWWFGNGIAGYPPVAIPTRVITQPAPPVQPEQPTNTQAPGQPTSTSNSTQEATNSESSASASDTVSPSSAAASSSTASGAPSSQNPSASASGVMPISEPAGSAPIGWIALGIAGVAGIVSFAWFKLRGRAKA